MESPQSNDQAAANPFNPPRAALSDPVTDDLPLASLGARLGASLIDSATIMVPVLIMLALGGGFDNSSGQPSPAQTAALIGSLIVILALFGVQLYLLYTSAQTIGKKALGIRIVDLEGNKAGFGRSFGLRGFVNGLITNVPFIGPFYALVDILFIFREDRRCIHDLIAGTQVRVAPKP